MAAVFDTIGNKIGSAKLYDLGISKIANYNSGTHEISLQFGIPRKGGAFISPRFLD